MKTFIMAMTAVACFGLATPAMAQDGDSPCRRIGEARGELYLCPLPEDQQKRKCQLAVSGLDLLCDGPVFGPLPANVVQPSNCKYIVNRKGARQYWCSP